jgi:hypothetical protein
MFITAQFTIVKLWKQTRCPTTDDWIKKTWYIYTQWSFTQSPGIMTISGLKVNTTGGHHVKWARPRKTKATYFLSFILDPKDKHMQKNPKHDHTQTHR